MLKFVLLSYSYLDISGRCRVLLSLLATFIVSMTSVLYPFIFSVFVKNFLKGTPDNFFSFIVFLVFIYAAGRIISEGRWFLLSNVESQVSKSMRANFFSEMLNRSPSFISNHGHGKIQTTIKRIDGAIFAIFRSMFFSVMPILIQLVIVSAIIAYKLHIIYGLGVLLGVTIYMYLSILGSKMLDKVQKRFFSIEDDLSNSVSNTILGRFLIYIFHYEDAQKKVINNSMCLLEKAKAKTFYTRGVFGVVHAIVGSILVSFFLLYSLYKLRNGLIDIGDFIFINMAMLQILSPMENITKLYRELKMHVLSLKHANDLFENSPPIKFGSKEYVGRKNVSIEFRNVSFKYPESDVWIFKNISFKITGNKIIGIVGESGSGKSTIVELITRIYEPTSGTIYINDIPVSDYSKSALYEIFSMSPQKPLLLEGSIQDNIMMNLPTKSLEFFKDVCKKTLLDKFVNTLKGGYKYHLSGGDRNISEGQAQRINIARSLIHSRPILILDEITSSLDKETSEKIIKNIHEYISNRLTIFISHKESDLKNADVIFLLKDGKLTKLN